MKFQEYDLVRILKDCEEGVRKGEVGTVLLSFENPVEAYEVEWSFWMKQDGKKRNVLFSPKICSW